jgi:hypothetical protein
VLQDFETKLNTITTRRTFSQTGLRTAGDAGSQYMNGIAQLEERLKSSGSFLQQDSAAAAHQSFLRTSPETLQLGRMAMGAIEATRAFAKQ